VSKFWSNNGIFYSHDTATIFTPIFALFSPILHLFSPFTFNLFSNLLLFSFLFRGGGGFSVSDAQLSQLYPFTYRLDLQIFSLELGAHGELLPTAPGT
jgi:hypothetical protein